MSSLKTVRGGAKESRPMFAAVPEAHRPEKAHSFMRVGSDLFQGGAKELGPVIEEMRSIEVTPVEREFDIKWAHDLKKRVIEGNAVSFNWAVADLAQGGGFTRLRVNGQHSSWALASLLEEDALPDGLAIHRDTYSVANEMAAVLLFRQFDARKSSRSKEDISGAYQCFQPALRDCNRSHLKTAADGVAWYRNMVQRSQVIPGAKSQPLLAGDDIYMLFDEQRLHPFFLMIDGVLKNGKSGELQQVHVLATAYGTWLENPKDAAEFWRLTALGNLRNETDAAADLDAELLRINKENEKVSAGDRYAKCVKAWHAFNEGVRVSQKDFQVNTKKKGLPPLGDLSS